MTFCGTFSIVGVWQRKYRFSLAIVLPEAFRSAFLIKDKAGLAPCAGVSASASVFRAVGASSAVGCGHNHHCSQAIVLPRLRAVSESLGRNPMEKQAVSI